MATAPFPAMMIPEMTTTATPPGGGFERRRQPARRRANFEQGRALEALGHAIEYLADSRMFFATESMPDAKSQAEAIQILSRASRAVFEECVESVSLPRMVGRWIGRRVGDRRAPNW